MESNREVFLRMQESEYLEIPQEIRERHLFAKRIDSDNHDWKENMEDPTFEKFYKLKKQASKDLEERKYQLRENKRNGK